MLNIWKPFAVWDTAGKNSMRRLSLTIRIFFCFCLIILLSVLVPSCYLLHSIHEESIELTRNIVLREATFLRAHIAGEFQERGLSALENLPAILKEFTSEEHRITLIDKAGVVLYDSFSQKITNWGDHRRHQEVAEAFENGYGTSVRDSISLEAPFVYAALKTSLPDDSPAVIRVAAPLALVEEHASERRQALIAGACTAIVAALLCAAIIAMRFRDSLRLMIRSVESLAATGEKSARISLNSLPGQEFAPLASAVNSMAIRMARQMRHISAQKSQLDAVLDSISEGVLVLDREGRIRSTNAALCRFFPAFCHSKGHRPEEIIPSEQMRDGIQMLMAQASEKSIPFILDNEAGRKLQVQLCPIVDEKTELLAVAVFHDITEMSALMEMRRDFVANVSHELRTPLTAVMGYAESLKRYVTEPRGQHFLEVVDRNAQYMAILVKDLLQLSSIENGSLPMEFSPIPASKVIRGGIALCRTSAEARRLEFAEELEQGDFLLRADLEYLTQVMRNLLENACRYAPEGSTIRISATPEKIAGRAVFRVMDSGPGIPAELRVRVFERFFRVEKHRGVSTGLGLAICKHIIERHCGSISVEEGPGCIMRFSVPLA